MTGYEALREGAAWLALTGRGRILVKGEDRARLLHAMCTHHVQQLQPGQGCWAMFLNAKGQILADAYILAREEDLLLDTEPEKRRALAEHLDRYIIADDVTLEDVSETMDAIGVEGPRAREALTSLGLELPAGWGQHVRWAEGMIAWVAETSHEGYRFYLPVSAVKELTARLEGAGIPQATAEEARVVRMENGKPRHGSDYLETNLPHETQLLFGVHFNKGCYLGQEIVERVRSRGAVNRLLVRVAMEGDAAPPAGAVIRTEKGEAGRLMDAVYSPAQGRIVGFALLRAELVRNPPPLEIEGRAVSVVAPQPAMPA